MDRQLFSTLLEQLSACIAVFMLAFSFNASANNIKIHVHDANNAKPLKGVAVCLGTSANPNQFAALRTDARGNAVFSETLPRTQILLTVSDPQHKGLQRILPTGDIDLVRTIDLPRGGLGPVCEAPPAMIEIKPGISKHNALRIADLKLDRGHKVTTSRSVVLIPRISGQPTHYRISEDPEFKDSSWQEFQKTPLYTLSNGEGRKRVFFQVRRAVEKDSGIIQITSNVASDWITFKIR